ncbi:MAG TPA: hypothetical protein VGK13_04630 [Methanocellaceae archaeon]
MRFFKLIILAMVVFAIIATAGCVNLCKQTTTGVTSTPTITPTPVPTTVATPTLPAVNDTIEKQYNYVDKINAGINEYNAGIQNMKLAQAAYNGSDYNNASQTIHIAINNMNNAKAQFNAMQQYASTDSEYNLSGKWYETANYYSICFNYLDQGYQEFQNQSTHVPPNYIKERFFFEEAQYYNGLANQSFSQAKELEKQTFLAQQG